jgi:MFS family permease
MPISKWSILLLVCAAAFGSYYSFETPSVLHNAMLRHYGFTDPTQFEFYFSLIYSLYALPNMALPLVGGLLSDKFGNRAIMLSVATLVLLGSGIETTSYFTKNMTLFLVGRFIFGCGSETLYVCSSVVISKWFKGQELALAMAINLSLSKLATVVTDWTSPLLYRRIGIENNAVWVTALCFICYLLTILLLKYDTDESHANQMAVHADRLLGNLASQSLRAEEGQHLLGNTESTRDGSGLELTNMNGSVPTAAPTDSSCPTPQQRPTPTNEQHTWLGFTPIAWALFLFTFTMYGTFIPFTNWSSVILIRFYFTVPNPTAEFIMYREITAAR